MSSDRLAARGIGSRPGRSTTTSAETASAVELLAGQLRTEILDGRRAGGERLREEELARGHGAARHTVRAALRQLAAEGFVRLAPNAGARVASLGGADIADLHATRLVLELHAAERALEMGAGRLPAWVHDAAAAFAALCRGGAAWPEVVVAHAGLHDALVAAAGSPRLTRAHAALSVELTLFLVQARGEFPPEALAAEHLELVAGLERRGPVALREHLEASRAALLGGASSRPSGGPPSPDGG